MMSNNNNKYVNGDVSTRDVDEAAIYRDAWRIADPGASNPVAVAATLREASSALLHHIGTDGVRKHPALRLMAAQLASLYNVNADGGGGFDGEDDDFIELVKNEVDAQAEAHDEAERLIKIQEEQGTKAAQQEFINTIGDMLK